MTADIDVDGGSILTRTTDGNAPNSEPAKKTWADGSIKWYKVDNSTGLLLGGATFNVCRTHDYNSPIPTGHVSCPCVCSSGKQVLDDLNIGLQ